MLLNVKVDAGATGTLCVLCGSSRHVVFRDCSADPQLRRLIVEASDVVQEAINAHPNARPHWHMLLLILGKVAKNEQLDLRTTWTQTTLRLLEGGQRRKQDLDKAPIIVRYDRGSDLSEAVKRRRGENNVCGEDIAEIRLGSHDEVIACIQRCTSHRDIVIPQRGDRRLYSFIDDRDRRAGYTNAGYTCIADGVACGILEKMPGSGAHFCHPKWDIVEEAKPGAFYNPNPKWWAKQSVRLLQTDLRHHIGKTPGSYRVGGSPVPTITCDEAAWVRLDILLKMDVLWSHAQRNLDPLLHAHDSEERKRRLNRRLQMLFDGNRLNFDDSGKIRLQFLGIRVSEPPDPDDVVHDAQPFERRTVSMDVQKQKLRLHDSTRYINQERLDHSDSWVRPWAIKATSGHSVDRRSVMEIDPSKFAIAASNSLLNQFSGAYHVTEYYNLRSIMEEGSKAGRDLVGDHSSSGRLRSHWVFPPWDQNNRVTRSRSSVERCIPLVTLYVPILDIIREGGKVTESGVIICSRPVPFRLVNEVWVCLPDVRQRQGFDHVEKILDYELEDELCVEHIKSPASRSIAMFLGTKSIGTATKTFLQGSHRFPPHPHFTTKRCKDES